MVINDAELLAIRDRCEKATAGPWTWGDSRRSEEDRAQDEAAGIDVDAGKETYERSWLHTYETEFVVLGCESADILEEQDPGDYRPSPDDADFIAHARMDVPALLAWVDHLRLAIAEHHSQRADDRCFEDDDRLYAAAGLPPADKRVGDKDEMLKNCARFIDRRCQGGGWPSYRQLEEERDRLLEVCRAVVEQLSPSVVNVVIRPGREPYSVRLAREALDGAKVPCQPADDSQTSPAPPAESCQPCLPSEHC
jgi:hypothetical protein